ncbi:MAG: ABC transporter ATP-binding protein [Acidobacteria bacterium]|jgi:simple sugar transport system ATP-binding protein|nr:MAG: ABC transporter ATP-binding protein [Acidobacteriota bacterium]GIU82683.1 MAG: ABC transporter ATP-binding protein [Pyrinomonadaceae bacterium]
MLELKGITKRFGNVVANNNVSIKVEPGTIHAIVGENGAGKSTAMRIAYGFYKPDSGEIFFNGQKVEFSSPHDAIALGIGMVHQHFMLVENMTVTENIILGEETGSRFRLDVIKAENEITELSSRLRLNVNPKALIEDLSVGQQQRVELLKALYRKANFLILDEPTAVLTPQEVEEFFGILRRMRSEGKTVVIITHKLEEVLAISDNVTVMRDGCVVGNLKTAETNAQELARLIVGREVLLRVEKEDAKPKEVVLEVEGLFVQGKHGIAVNGVSFNVRAGEIVGIAGVEGNGQTELIEAIAGLMSVSNGKIKFKGSEINSLSVRERIELGIAHIPEDRQKRGLLLNFDLRENAILGVHHRKSISSNGLINKVAVENHTKEIIERFDVRPPNPLLPAKALSGGNQQKLVVGRELSMNPKLLLVAQPTRGVDIGAVEFIHRKLVEMRDSGTAILLVSAELEEVKSLADRLLVIRKGRIVGEVDPKSASVEQIGLMMTGGE